MQNNGRIARQEVLFMIDKLVVDDIDFLRPQNQGTHVLARGRFEE